MTSLLSLTDSLGHGWAYRKETEMPATLAARLRPYRATLGADPDPWDPSRRWPNVLPERPRSVVIDLDLLAGPSLDWIPDGTHRTGEQALVPADYRTVLDLVRAS